MGVDGVRSHRSGEGGGVGILYSAYIYKYIYIKCIYNTYYIFELNIYTEYICNGTGTEQNP